MTDKHQQQQKNAPLPTIYTDAANKLEKILRNSITNKNASIIDPHPRTPSKLKHVEILINTDNNSSSVVDISRDILQPIQAYGFLCHIYYSRTLDGTILTILPKVIK